eukprot:11078483-Alexandrium_andersonii.AAC.1
MRKLDQEASGGAPVGAAADGAASVARVSTQDAWAPEPTRPFDRTGTAKARMTGQRGAPRTPKRSPRPEGSH